MNFRVQPLDAGSLEEAFALATEVFVAHSTLHRALGITLDAYRSHLWPSFRDMATEGLSVIALSSDNTLVGCLMATDFQTTLSPKETQGPFAPLAALTSALCDTLSPEARAEPAVLVDMAAVSPDWAGRGVYRALRENAHSLAEARGYGLVRGELSSAATQHVVLKTFGHQKIAEVPFATFTSGGRRPFAQITEPPTFVLSEGRL